MYKVERVIIIFLISISAFFAALLEPTKISSQNAQPELELVGSILSQAGEVDIEGNFAFVTSGGGIQFIDISNPSNPLLKTNLPPDGCGWGYLDAVPNYLYVTQTQIRDQNCTRYDEQLLTSMHVFSVSESGPPFEMGYVQINGPGAPTEVMQSSSYVYVPHAHGGLKIINITNPGEPELVNSFANGVDFRDVQVVGTTLYLADLSGRLWIVDVSDPLNPAILSNQYLPVPGNALAVDIVDNYAYIAAGSWFLILDVSDPINPQHVGNIDWRSDPTFDGYVADVKVEGDYAYTANWGSGLIAIDISDPANPVEVDRYDLGGVTTKVIVENGVIYVADLEKGLNIFQLTGLSQDVVLDVPLFKQTDPAWGGLEYAGGPNDNLNCGSTVAQCGCATTSIAMILKYHDVDKDPYGNPTAPKTVNDYFKRDQVCDGDGCRSLGYRLGNVWWPAVGLYSNEVSKIFGSPKIILTGIVDSYDATAVQSEILNERPAILKMPGKQHWAVAKGITNDTFAINDPGYDRFFLNDPAYENNALAMRFFEKTSSDFSSFEVSSRAPTQILVTDSYGRKTGYDVSIGNVLQEIPNSVYYFEEAYADVTGENSPPSDAEGIYTALILTPQGDNYNVEVIAPVNEKYVFTVYASNRDAGLDFNLFGGSEDTGEHNYSFEYSPDPADEPFVQNIEIQTNSLLKVGERGEEDIKLVKIAVLTNDSFNAPQVVDRTSLSLSVGENEGTLYHCRVNGIDVDSDGDLDLLCAFQFSQIIHGISEAFLSGKTIKGVQVSGSDEVIFP